MSPVKKTRVAINGLGRIGRAFYKLASVNPALEIVAVNDLSERENLEYLLRHDSVYGKWDGKFDVKFLQEKDPVKLPWDELKTCIITSNGSCTTNSASPVMQILSEKIGIEKAFLNTVHGYTATQSLVDSLTKGEDYRRGRAAAINIVPSTAGAAISVGRAIHELLGKFDGVAMRVPVSTGSLSAIVFLSTRETTPEEINTILEEAAKESRWQGILTTTRDQIVSTDIIGNPYAAIADLTLTHVTGGNLCAVYSWYDNEMGYTYVLLDHVVKFGKQI